MVLMETLSTLSVTICGIKDLSLSDQLIGRIPRDIRIRYESYAQTTDRVAFLIGRVLLWWEIGKPECFFDWLNKIKIDVHGKPHIGKIYNFNISHSGNYVTVGIGHYIGVDIQRIQSVNISEFSCILSREECRYLRAAKRPDHEFAQIWASKEAIVKAAGVGLSDQVKNIYTLANESVTYGNKKWVLIKCVAPKGYAISAAVPEYMEGMVKMKQITSLQIDRIINQLIE
jgi:4'-phosphopantetheinyl transferase